MYFQTKKEKLVGLSILIVLFCLGCGGGGNSGTGGPAITGPVTTGQALLGALTNANVDVYAFGDLQDPIYSTTTLDSVVLSEAGQFDIPIALLEPDRLYMLAVSGGEDIDADDDFQLDAIPTQNQGVIRLVATGAMLRSGEFNVSILTEIMYQKIAYQLYAHYAPQSIVDTMNQYVPVLISEDVDGDDDRDMEDILSWNPVVDKYKTTKDWSFFQDCIPAVHLNQPIVDKLSSLELHIAGKADLVSTSRGLAVASTYAYAAVGYGLQVIDIGDVANPEVTGMVDTPRIAWTAAVSGSYAYVADDTSGLQVVDVSDPASPTIAGSVQTPGRAMDVAVSGNYAYVADDDYVLSVVDISDPGNPIITGSLASPEWGIANGVAVSGSYAYVTLMSKPVFYVVDISDPANPTIVGSMTTLGYAAGVCVSGTHAYVISLFSGLQVVNISDPADPTLIATFDTPGAAGGITVSGDLAFVADSTGLMVLNVGDPANPVLSGKMDYMGFGAGPTAVAVSGNYAYVADDFSDLEIVDISSLIGNPKHPALIGALETESSALDICVAGGLA